MGTIKSILHPTDFSEASESALNVACSLARDNHARLILLHVMPYPPAMLWGDRLPTPRFTEHLEEDIVAYRNDQDRKLNALNVPDSKILVEHLLREGDIVESILRVAEQTPCDLIVLGTRGEGASTQGLLGSVAESVSRGASCPVLTVLTPRSWEQPTWSPLCATVGAGI